MNFAQFILSLSSKMEKGIYKLQHIRIWALFSLFWIIVAYFHFGVFESTFVSNNTVQNNLISISGSLKLDKVVFPFIKAMKTMENESDPCGGRYVYIHNLPSRFNDDMIKNCGSISNRYDMCKFTKNNGFGPLLNNTEGVFSANGWYETNDHTLSVIFHNRMKHYECLTSDSSVASAIFVPFYAGFDASRYRSYDISVRDAASNDLVKWLQQRDEWKYMNGKDHFLVSGRVTWDFRRQTDERSDWGNKFLLSPAAKNMSMLLTESSPRSSNDFAIPYPTYFHPSKDVEVFEWQDQMRKMERKWLFSFVGAPRPGNTKSIRSLLIDQCKNSNVGNLLDCGVDESKCRSPSSVINTFQSSVYCLQPRGDSSARRSAFDSILGGCIPVFFHPNSFYVQYTWHIPKNYTKYSVFIPEDDIRKNISIEKRLSQIDPKTVKMMREEVISMIPRLLYADPDSKLGIEDAFDVALKAIISKVTKLRQDIIDGSMHY